MSFKQRATRFKKGKIPKSQPIPIPGKRPVEEILRRGLVPIRLWTVRRLKETKEDSLTARCRAAGWRIEMRDSKELDQAAEGLPHQGYVAFIREFLYTDIENLHRQVSADQHSIILALDQIQDAGNLGAILRSAECAGVSGVLIPLHQSAGITAAVIRRSAGAALHIPVSRVVNLGQALEEFKRMGYRVLGADQEGARQIYRTDLKGPIILVIGSEGRGLRPGVKRRCDTIMAIPLAGKISSLNASAAAAVCLFEAVRQRMDS